VSGSGRGRVSKRKKKLSKPYRNAFGHTPLSLAEPIPWKCRRLVVGTGAHGSLPVLDEVLREGFWADLSTASRSDW
jgi:hypothetical protein